GTRWRNAARDLAPSDARAGPDADALTGRERAVPDGTALQGRRRFRSRRGAGRSRTVDVSPDRAATPTDPTYGGRCPGARSLPQRCTRMVKRLLALIFFTAAVGLAACSPAASSAPTFGTTDTTAPLPTTMASGAELPTSTP